MQIKRREVGLTVDDSLMRLYVVEPVVSGQYPGILFYSDIYQLGGPILRLADRLAGYGYVVAAPEIFHRLEPIGTVIEPNDLGRLRGNDAASRTEVAQYDADAAAALHWLQTSDTVAPGQLGTVGFCIGGHLSCRAALNPIVKAAVCCYPTGIHSGKLGKDRANTLERLSEINAHLLLVFGDQDPHVPAEGRDTILNALTTASVDHKTLIYLANHTFMRDDGYRYDPAATDAAWAEVVTFLAHGFGTAAPHS
ncbi:MULTISPECIES: dienelactone hydrolase family protein [Cyanophyceae]|uniref:Dienelactone hydrolase family protein n=1 Tax=Leptolyngbya subtilissima DQ-A4 TaxID=2933933 RepID=A0ABV0K2L4_9CYAN|nr:dienelactone hydrolase family protein [Nodosilinea sp. FACHB-141]MBD2111530.1 dienelactone hydrolase family protein [Nodosilinea sp. FACHB-141]